MWPPGAPTHPLTLASPLSSSLLQPSCTFLSPQQIWHAPQEAAAAAAQ